MQTHPEYASMTPKEVNVLVAEAMVAFKQAHPDEYRTHQAADVDTIRNPYAFLGGLLVFIWIVFFFKVPAPAFQTPPCPREVLIL